MWDMTQRYSSVVLKQLQGLRNLSSILCKVEDRSSIYIISFSLVYHIIYKVVRIVVFIRLISKVKKACSRILNSSGLLTN